MVRAQCRGGELHGAPGGRSRPFPKPSLKHSDARPVGQGGRGADRFRVAGRAGRIAGIPSLQHIVDRGQIRRGPRERPHVIEAVDEGKGAAAGQAAVGGLETEDAAQ